MATEVIDEKITNHCGKYGAPSLNSIEIKKISDIPTIIAAIREHRCGPKLNFGSKSVSTEFRSGFYDKSARYVEQLYILFGSKSSHKSIADLFDCLDLKRFKKDEKLKKIGAELQCFDTFVKKYLGPLKNICDWVETNDQIPNANKIEIARKMINNYTKTSVSVFYNLHELIQNDINDLISMGSSLTLEETVLKERLVGVWFLAETFRYPPMLFYSLVLLHLLINGVINTNQIRDLHPAYEEGSQKSLIFSFIKDSDCELEVFKFDEKLVKAMKKKKMEIVKLLYKDVYKHLSSTYFLGNHCNEVFESYCEHYLNLCGIKVTEEISQNLNKLAKGFAMESLGTNRSA